MSYDMAFVHPVTGEVAIMKEAKALHGGTYRIGDEDYQADFNITYNYSPFFYAVFGELGIRSLYGKPAWQVSLLLASAIVRMGAETTDNYWDSTEGNARAALVGLMLISEQVPQESILNGD